MKRKEIVFEGNDISREEFEGNFLNFFDDFLGSLETNPQHIQFYTLLWEMIKNIYDHAEGKGKVILSMQNLQVDFLVKDFGTANFDLNKIKVHGSTKLGNGINSGLGLCMGLIEDSAKGIDIDLKINTSRGFCYTGIYKLR